MVRGLKHHSSSDQGVNIIIRLSPQYPALSLQLLGLIRYDVQKGNLRRVLVTMPMMMMIENLARVHV